MATDVTGVEDVMGEVAHFWQLRKFQFIEEATDFWMNAVAPKYFLLGRILLCMKVPRFTRFPKDGVTL